MAVRQHSGADTFPAHPDASDAKPLAAGQKGKLALAMDRFSEELRDYLKCSVGFAFYLAWYYHTFFLSALGIAAEPLWCEAWVWEFVQCAMGVSAIAAALVLLRVPAAGGTPLGIVAAASSALGSVFIGVGHLEGESWSSVVAVGEVMCGIAIASFVLIWGSWLSLQEEDRAERDMLVSFGLGAVICIALLCTEGYLRVALSTLLGIVASWFAFRGPLKKAKESPAPDPASSCARQHGATEEEPEAGFLKQHIPVVAVYFLLWLSFSYLRIMTAPSLTGGDVLFLPFACALIVAGAGLGACISLSSRMNFTLVYRWALPLIMLSCGILYAIPFEEGRAAAYLVNFIAMFGSQAACLIAAAKRIHRHRVAPYCLFAALLAADGFGVVAGAKLGSVVSDVVPLGGSAGVSLIVVGLVLLATMALGFGEGWLPSTLTATAKAAEEPPRGSTGADADMRDGEATLYESIGAEARYLRDTYGLTKRETEVVFLLLEGRNRPYIRDELTISLHTVHAHVRNIFAKCDVHSQQELIDLVRPGNAAKLSETLEESGSRSREH